MSCKHNYYCKSYIPLQSYVKKSEKVQPKSVILPKMVISSKRLPPLPNQDRKTGSTGKIHINNSIIGKPKKVTKSDNIFSKNKHVLVEKINRNDYCKSIGDPKSSKKTILVSPKSSKTSKSTNLTVKSSRDLAEETNILKKNTSQAQTKTYKETVQQYYRNENFDLSSENESNSHIKQNQILDTIRESPEVHVIDNVVTKSDIHIVSDHLEPESTYSSDSNDKDSLQQIKEFRQQNYFECHSSKTRLKNLVTAPEHKCMFSFYLNERLFPVPIKTDHKNTIRCMECNLPVDSTCRINSECRHFMNGMIQAKVSIDSKDSKDVKDMTILLPVKDSLIIKEKRNENKGNNDKEVVYFGVIKLNNLGQSVFSNNSPSNSFALRYEKGYKQLVNNNQYRYTKLTDDDVIVV